jgi:hypothetical protein
MRLRQESFEDLSLVGFKKILESPPKSDRNRQVSSG